MNYTSNKLRMILDTISSTTLSQLRFEIIYTICTTEFSTSNKLFRHLEITNQSFKIKKKNLINLFLYCFINIINNNIILLIIRFIILFININIEFKYYNFFYIQI